MNTYLSKNTFESGREFLNSFVDRNFDQEQDDTAKPEQFFDQPLEQDYGDVAMSRGQARGIIDRLTQEAIKGNITPNAFQSSLGELSRVGTSPDYSRRLIRNALKTPAARLAIENPDLAKQALSAFGSRVSESGFNPLTGAKYVGAASSLLEQASKDNLLRSNVTTQETREKIQKPMYGALMDWTKSNLNNPDVQKILQKSGVGSNVQWGPRGFIPIAAGFQPEQFGVRLTPAAQKQQNEYNKRLTWERSPEGQKELQRQKLEGEQFRKDQQKIKSLLRQRGIRLPN